MNIIERFEQAAANLDDPDLGRIELLPVRLARACAQVLAVDGAGISVFADDFRVPLGASDPLAANAERLQFTLGEGPCLQAHEHAEPFDGDEAQISRQWPVFHAELVRLTPYRSIISHPLYITFGIGGALDLFLADPTRSTPPAPADITAVAYSIVENLSWNRTPSRGPGPGWLHGPSAEMRTNVWIAIGMLNAHYHLNTPNAFAVLRGYAYSHEQTLDDVAAQLRHLTLPVEHLAA